MAAKSIRITKRALLELSNSSKYTGTYMRKLCAWSSDGTIKSPYKDIEVPNCTLYDYVWQNLDKWPERTVSVCATTGRGYTYEQAFKLSNAFAANLRLKFKIRDGDTVVVMLPNIPDYPLVNMGILRAGAVISSINPIYTPHEVQRQLVMSDAKVVVTLPGLVKIIKDALQLAKLNIPIIVVKTKEEAVPEGTVLFNELSEDVHVDKSCLKQVKRSAKDLCLLPYSSGTTGLPKGVELSNFNIMANCEQMNEPLIRCFNDTTASHQDIFLSVIPFFHIYGATVLMFHKMSIGAKLVTLQKFTPDLFIQSIEKSKTNILLVAPPMFLLMGSHPAASEKTYRYLEIVANGAVPLAASDMDRFIDKIKRKIRLCQGYGLTETSPGVALGEKGFEDYNSFGLPGPSTELKIVDENMKSVGPNQAGELLIKGPQVMSGYRNNPQANAEVFTSDGWFRSGDLVTADNSGYMKFVDRLKELIKKMATKSIRITKRALLELANRSKYTGICIRKLSAWSSDGTIKSPYKDIEIPNCTLYDYVWQNLDKWPERTVSVCAITGRGYTYEQAFKLSNAFAANLRKKFKIRDGDTVTVMLPNIPDYPLINMGILGAGAVISSVNPIYTSHEVQRQLVMSNAKLVITLPELVKTVKDALKLAKLNIPIIVVKTKEETVPEGTVAFNELSEDVHVDKSCLKEVRRTAKDLCLLPYSSGTTGLPKGVELTNLNITTNCEQMNDPLIRCFNDTTASHQDTFLAVLPFFHIYGGTVLMFHKMSVGGKLVTLPKFSPDLYLQAIEKSKTNILFLAPPLVILMGNHPAASEKTYQHLEIVVNGAAPLAASDMNRFMGKIKRKIRLCQGYGLTETSPVVTIGEKGFEDYDSVGLPIPSTELKIVDGNMKSVGPNQTGELLIKGPQVMSEYRDNPQANAEVFTSDGWFRSGDLATADNNGYIKLVDRLKELIKVKGFQVPPAELEAVLREHPAINDAAVIGVPHPIKGESPKAFVVLKPGFDVTTKEISEFVTERVASYKRIDDIVVLDSIPKSSAGKILRKDLRAKYC